MFQSSQGIDIQQLQNAYAAQGQSPGSGAISSLWQSSGLGGLPNAQGISSPEGQAVSANTINYAMSDADFAKRYPQMIQAQQSYLGNLNNLLTSQTPASMAQGNSMMTGANSFMNAGRTLSGESTTIGQPDMALGQKLISGNQAIDPVVQQELMRSGLSSAASALGGAAGLGGQAGQAAVGRNLGVGAENWVANQRQQGEALQQTGAGLTTSLAGAAGGLGGTGANMATAGQGIVNSAQQNANAGFGLASSMFQPRSFGISGTDAANINLANTAGLNNMMQYLYSTKVQGAQYNTQIAAQNANASAQASGNMISGGAGAASAVAVGVAFAMSCWCAYVSFGPLDPRFHAFRFWLMNLAPGWFRRLYLRHGKAFAIYAIPRPLLRRALRFVMNLVVVQVPYAYA